MVGKTSCMVWCEDCTAENWDDVSAWKWEGRAVTRSGTLKAPRRCKSCEAELAAGARVEAIMVYDNLHLTTRWMEKLVVLDEENAESEAGEP
jgi:hypothetical protein